MKARRLIEDIPDLGLGYAVIDDEIEADFGERDAQFGGGALDRLRLAREVGAEIQDGNGVRVRAHSAACWASVLSTS